MTGPSSPLLSWDIFIDHYQEMIRFGNDVQELRRRSAKGRWQGKWDWMELLHKKNKVIILTDIAQNILFASSNLIRLTGYDPTEVIGQQPRLFQGKDTEPAVRAEIRAAIAAVEPFDVRILNYKKRGIPYICRVEGFPLFDRAQRLDGFIAFETMG